MNNTDVADVEFEVSYKRDGKTHTYKGVATQAKFEIAPDDDYDFPPNYNSIYVPKASSKDLMLTLKDYSATYQITEKRGVARTAEVRIDALTEREVERARDLAGVDKDTEFAVEQRSEIRTLRPYFVLVFCWED